VGLVTSASGVVQYYREILYDNPLKQWEYGFYCYLLFFFLLGATEYHFRLERKKEDPFIYPELVMDEDELEARLQDGEPLCLLDDLILDIGEYAKYHPGGAFLISQNIGRDASKFFYGGYTMANKDTTHGYCHSNYARKVASSIAIATLNRVTKVMKAEIDMSQTN
jgi:cytochrome b involved in lipid metabolism